MKEEDNDNTTETALSTTTAQEYKHLIAAINHDPRDAYSRQYVDEYNPSLTTYSLDIHGSNDFGNVALRNAVGIIASQMWKQYRSDLELRYERFHLSNIHISSSLK